MVQLLTSYSWINCKAFISIKNMFITLPTVQTDSPVRLRRSFCRSVEVHIATGQKYDATRLKGKTESSFK